MKDQKSIILRTVMLFIIGFALAYLGWLLMGMKENVWLVLLIFAPNFIFLVYSGIVREVRFKGVELVLQDVANEPVKGDFGSIAPSQKDMIEVGEQGITLLEKMLAEYSLSEEKPIVMAIRLGDTYPILQTLGFIEKLSRYRSFKFVVFVDREGRLIAYIPAWALRQILSKPGLGKEFVEVIENVGRRNELFNYQNAIRETIKVGCKNLEALQLMDKLNLSAIPVIDEKEQLQGVIERDRLISRMMLNLVEKSAK